MTLYELAILEPAFDGPDRQELLLRIAEQEPQPPGQLDASFPRDLEIIVLDGSGNPITSFSGTSPAGARLRFWYTKSDENGENCFAGPNAGTAEVGPHE